ncbi:MAG: hypothetical protein KGY74_07710 [Candidatus Cloacimonetes bacterium]|nr:hypothetical protein [Candidatus Cloacimonadota bacterium]
MKKFTFLVALFLGACTATYQSGGGLGNKTKSTKYIYKVQDLKLEDHYGDIDFTLDIAKEEGSPVEPAIDYIYDSFKKEIENNKGNVLKDNKSSDILLKIDYSKYTTKEFGSFNDKYYKTFIDLKYSFRDNLKDEMIAENIQSLSENGSYATESNLNANQKAIKNILRNEDLINFLDNIKKSSSSVTSKYLNRLSKNLLRDFKTNKKGENYPVNIAFVGLENDKSDFSALITSSLKNVWPPTEFKFYTRRRINNILEEYKLSLSGITGNEKYMKDLELKSVEYIIGGNITKPENEQIIELQIIDVKNGEIVASESIHVIK